MTEADIDGRAWEVVREVRDKFLGRRAQPTDDDWQAAIATALASAEPLHDAAEVAWAAFQTGYYEGYDAAHEGRPHRFKKVEAA
jgi:hypothetical protein